MLYQIFILLYQFSFSILKTFSAKLRKRDIELDHIYLPNKTKDRIWIHCASAGEYEQCVPLIQKIRSNLDSEICISFYSPSGMEYYLLDPVGDFTFYLPIDTKKNARNLLNTIQPDIVIWVRYEFWQNILNEIFNRNIPSILLYVDLKQQDEKIFWERKRRLKIIRKFKKIYSVTHSLLIETPYEIIQDGKWEKSLENTLLHYQNEMIHSLNTEKKSIVLGSAHMSDIEILNSILYQKDFADNYNWIIVPHEIDENHISRIKKTLASHLHLSNIVFITQLGVLKHIYRYADIAWIGGGFDKSVHNVLEASAYKIPIICGPKINKAEEAKLLFESQLLFTFKNADDCVNTLQKVEKLSKEEIENAIEILYTKNAVENYSTNILEDIHQFLSRKN